MALLPPAPPPGSGRPFGRPPRSRGAAGRAADDTAERERNLRFPPAVAGKDAYVESDPDPGDRHASAQAHGAFRAMKYGVRIHRGLYSMLPEARESWDFLRMTNAERQAYRQPFRSTPELALKCLLG